MQKKERIGDRFGNVNEENTSHGTGKVLRKEFRGLSVRCGGGL